MYKPGRRDVGSVHLVLKVTDSETQMAAARKIGWTPVVEGLVKMDRGDSTMWSSDYVHRS